MGPKQEDAESLGEQTSGPSQVEWQISRPLSGAAYLLGIESYSILPRNCSPTVYIDCVLTAQNSHHLHHVAHGAESQLECWSLFRQYSTLKPRIVTSWGLRFGNHEYYRALQHLMQYELVRASQLKSTDCSIRAYPRSPHLGGWEGEEQTWIVNRTDVGELQRRLMGELLPRRAIHIGIINRRGTRRLSSAGCIMSAFVTMLTQSTQHYSVSLADDLGDLAFVEQARWVRDKDVLIAPHGAQNINFMWARPCAAILEIYPKGYYIPGHLLQLARAVGAMTFAAYPGHRPYHDTRRTNRLGTAGEVHAREGALKLNVSTAKAALLQMLGARHGCLHASDSHFAAQWRAVHGHVNVPTSVMTRTISVG